MSDVYDDDEVYDDDGVVVPIANTTYAEPETEDLLLRAREVVAAAQKVPLSASSMISKEELLELLDAALDRLPDELRAARWLLKEREEYLAKVRREGDEIIEQARARAERMVQRTEVVKASEQRAYDIVDRAETQARQLRHEVEDFCDQKLASFEIVLERTLTMVASGRAKLQGTNLTAGIPVDEPVDDVYEDLPPPPDDAYDGYEDGELELGYDEDELP